MEKLQRHVPPGTRVYKRSDIKQVIERLRQRWLTDLQEAKNRGNKAWEYQLRDKLENVSLIQDRIDEKCTVFVNNTDHILPEENDGCERRDTIP